MGDIGKETDALLVEIPFVLAFDRFDLLSLLLLGTPHPVIQTDSRKNDGWIRIQSFVSSEFHCMSPLPTCTRKQYSPGRRLL